MLARRERLARENKEYTDGKVNITMLTVCIIIIQKKGGAGLESC